MAKQNVRKNKKKYFFKKLRLITWIISIILLTILYFLNVIPLKYFLIISGIFIILNIFLSYLIITKSWKKRMVGTIFSILFILTMTFGIFYEIHTLKFLNTIESANLNTKNYSVIVLKNSEYTKIKDLKGKTLALNNNLTGTTEAKEKIAKKVDVNFKNINEEDLVDILYNQKAEAILLEDSERKILEEEHDDFSKKEKVIYNFTVDIKIDVDLAKEVDITKEPFNVYISGIDTYGKISNVSRSDVNMLVSVNPQNHQILFTSIPRDYYVKLASIDTTYKDKLTHAGIYGIDVSIKTIENLLDTKINYYAKVNFTSLVKIVDKLGGIDIENDMNFVASYNEDGKDIYFEYQKGNIHLNGEQALAYARERKSLALGDLARNHHQQIILEGIIKKAMSPSIIVKYNSILDAMENNFVTNIGSKNITNFVKKQIKSNDNWKIDKYFLNGTNDYQYTYSYKTAKSYVMQPDEESLINAKKIIKETLNQNI